MPEVVYLPKGSKPPYTEKCIVVKLRSRGSESIKRNNGLITATVLAPFLDKFIDNYKDSPLEYIFVIGKRF